MCVCVTQKHVSTPLARRAPGPADGQKAIVLHFTVEFRAALQTPPWPGPPPRSHIMTVS